METTEAGQKSQLSDREPNGEIPTTLLLDVDHPVLREVVTAISAGRRFDSSNPRRDLP